MEVITFIAALPVDSKALKIGQDETRIVLDVPASEREAVKQLMDCYGKNLKITVEELV